MSFKQFLQESTNQAELVLHQLIDNLDVGHLSYTNDTITVNVGQIIQKSNLSNLYLVIRASKTGNNTIRLAHSDGKSKYTIVVDTLDDIPKRKEIDSFIANNEYIYSGISNELNRYLEKKLFDKNIGKNSTELKNYHNTVDGFEEQYNNIVQAMDEKINEFNIMVKDLKTKHDTTNHQGEKNTYREAVKHLHKDTLGDSFSAFAKIAKGSLNEKEFISNMNPEFKKKLDSRLSSYYEQNVANLGKFDW